MTCPPVPPPVSRMCIRFPFCRILYCKCCITRYLENKSKCSTYKQYTRTAIAYEWQCNSFEWQDTYHCTNVNNGLYAKPRKYTNNKQTGLFIWSTFKYVFQACKQRNEQPEQYACTDKTKHLSIHS